MSVHFVVGRHKPLIRFPLIINTFDSHVRLSLKWIKLSRKSKRIQYLDMTKARSDISYVKSGLADRFRETAGTYLAL